MNKDFLAHPSTYHPNDKEHGQIGSKIPYIPIYVDSPMGNLVLEVFSGSLDWHKLSDKEFRHMFDHAHVITAYEQTWEVINKKGPKKSSTFEGNRDHQELDTTWLCQRSKVDKITDLYGKHAPLAL